MRIKTIIKYVVLAFIAGSSIAGADEMTLAFLNKHCIRCPGADKQKADSRFDTLAVQISKPDDLERYQ